MPFLYLFCLACLLFPECMHSQTDNSYWTADHVRNYVHYSEIQRRWAWSFLAPHVKTLTGNEYILDVGCGDGKITADLSNFVPKGKVVGIDPSTAMLAWAKRQYCQDYPNLSFHQGGFLNPNTEQPFDVVVSFCALQHCSDQWQAIQNLSHLLKPGGKLLILIPALSNMAWGQAYKNLRQSSRWASYWKDFKPRQIFSLEEYEGLLNAAHLKPLRIEKITSFDPFVDQQEFFSWLHGTLPPVIPSELVQEFYNELIEEFLRLSPEAQDAEGIIYTRMGRIEIEAIKEE